MRESADAGSRIFYEANHAVVGFFLVGLFSLFDDQVDQCEFAGLNGLVGALDCGRDLRVLGDADAAATECIGHGGEVCARQLGAGDSARSASPSGGPQYPPNSGPCGAGCVISVEA